MANVRETDEAGRLFFADHYLSLRYEDMLKSPQVEIKRIWNFLGADISDPALDDIVAAEMQKNPDADWQRQKANEIVSVLEKGKQGSWRNLFTARDKAIFKEVAGATLETWGYPADGGDW